MARLLTKRSFTSEDLALAEIQQFQCGPERWDGEVADWIESPSGPKSALHDMGAYRTEVWLYLDDQGELVGFGSLGQTTYTWPVGGKKKEPVNLIPFIGIHEKFKGEPKDAARDDKYAYQILDDLLACAAEKSVVSGVYALIVPNVDGENGRAINFYQNRDFFDLEIPRFEKTTGITYIRMARYLDDLVKQLQEDSADGQDSAGP